MQLGDCPQAALCRLMAAKIGSRPRAVKLSADESKCRLNVISTGASFETRAASVDKCRSGADSSHAFGAGWQAGGIANLAIRAAPWIVVVAAIVSALFAFAVLPTFGAEPDSEPPLPRANPSADAEPEEVVKPEPNPLVEDTDAPENVTEPEEPSPFGEETPPEPVDEKALAECEAELRKLGGIFERLPAIDGKGTCGMAAPYRLGMVGRGVRLEPASQMTCETALAFARWVNKVVVPATDALGDDTRLVAVRHGSTTSVAPQ